MRTLWPEPAKMEQTHIPTKPPKHLVTVADSTESQGLEEHTVWHREPKRSGRATRAVSVLMQKKKVHLDHHRAEANRPVLFADLSGSRCLL